MIGELLRGTAHHLSKDDRALFLEVRPGDAPQFTDELDVQGVQVGPYRVLRTHVKNSSTRGLKSDRFNQVRVSIPAPEAHGCLRSRLCSRTELTVLSLSGVWIRDDGGVPCPERRPQSGRLPWRSCFRSG